MTGTYPQIRLLSQNGTASPRHGHQLAGPCFAKWGGRGVRVNALAPGYFPTELTGHLSDAGFARSIREHTLLARTPQLPEIDGPLLFLATAASSYMTGQVLVIDGGWTAI